MKLLILLGFLACFIYLQSCGDGMIKHKSDPDKSGSNGHVKIPVPDATDNLVIKDGKDLVGYWVGTFDTLHYYEEYNIKINVSIDSIKGNAVKGHCIVAGTFTPFAGTMEKNGAKYVFSLKQPGTGKYDGAFKFSITEGDSILSGKWYANGKAKVRERELHLTKKLFHYNAKQQLEQGRFVDYNKTKTVKSHDEDAGDFDAEGYIMTTANIGSYNASTDVLTKEQVANMKKPNIMVLRNSIFARHGYAFKKEMLRMYFSYQDWYIPISTDVTADLTPIEKKNIGLLMRYEKNAKNYYDTFGR